jgi:hypothetical protein
MMRSKNFQLAFHLTATLLWPASTYAASVTLGQTLGAVPPIAWVVVLGRSFVSGLVSLLQRIKDEMKTPEGEVSLRRTWRWYLTAHMLGALFTGVLAFMVAEGTDIRDFYEAVCIAVFSWGGARVMDKMADGLTDGIVNKLVGLIGGTPPSRKE